MLHVNVASVIFGDATDEPGLSELNFTLDTTRSVLPI